MRLGLRLGPNHQGRLSLLGLLINLLELLIHQGLIILQVQLILQVLQLERFRQQE
jgi:hypothetical protein